MRIVADGNDESPQMPPSTPSTPMPRVPSPRGRKKSDVANDIFAALDNDDMGSTFRIIDSGGASGIVHEDGDTPLIWAVMMEKFDVVKALVERDPLSLNARSKNGNTALMWATELGLEEIASYLMKKGASQRFKNHEGKNALKIAKSMGSTRFVSILSGVSVGD